MLLLHIIILALVQGISEFLPISSSGHLILLHEFLDPEAVRSAEENRMIDIALHIGTLLAVLVYFYKDVFGMILGIKDIICRRKFADSENAQLTFYVLISSLPIIIIGGIVFLTIDPEIFYNPKIIICTLTGFALLLWYADKSIQTRSVEDITFKDALIIGLAQTLSIIPGVSRSGITMTTSRFLGLSRTQAARYSLLLAIIATSAVGAVGILKIIKSGDTQLSTDAGLAVLFTFITGLCVITFMMKWLSKFSFTPFVIYRICLSAGLFWYLFMYK